MILFPNTAFSKQFKYTELLDERSFVSPLSYDLHAFQQQILAAYPLYPFQKTVLINFFEALKTIQEQVDPHRISDFAHKFNENEDEDLFLWRRNSKTKGLFYLSIHPEDDFSLFRSGKEKQELNHFDENADFEIIALHFLS